MESWNPATEAEAAMRDVLRAGDQEQYFRILARLDLLLPVSADSAGRRSPGWGTWSSDGRTHVLAFTSIHAMRACLAEHAGNYRLAQFRELAEQWPNPEWWLAINPGLPIEGYLPAWFVAQISRGDVRLPGRAMGSRVRMEHANSLRARAVAQVPQAPPRRIPPAPPVPASGGRLPPGRRPPGAGIVLSGEIVESSTPVADEAIPAAAAGPSRPAQPMPPTSPMPPSSPVSPARVGPPAAAGMGGPDLAGQGPARPGMAAQAPGGSGLRGPASAAARGPSGPGGGVVPGIPGASGAPGAASSGGPAPGVTPSGLPTRQPGAAQFGRGRPPADLFPSSPGPAPGAVPVGSTAGSGPAAPMPPTPVSPASSRTGRTGRTDRNGRADVGEPYSRAEPPRLFERPDFRQRTDQPPPGPFERPDGGRPGVFEAPPVSGAPSPGRTGGFPADQGRPAAFAPEPGHPTSFPDQGRSGGFPVDQGRPGGPIGPDQGRPGGFPADQGRPGGPDSARPGGFPGDAGRSGGPDQGRPGGFPGDAGRSGGPDQGRSGGFQGDPGRSGGFSPDQSRPAAFAPEPGRSAETPDLWLTDTDPGRSTAFAPDAGRRGGLGPEPQPVPFVPDPSRLRPLVPDEDASGGFGSDPGWGAGAPDQGRPEQGRPEQGRAEQGRPEQSRPDQAWPEQGRPEQVRPAAFAPDHAVGAYSPDQGVAPTSGGSGPREASVAPGALGAFRAEPAPAGGVAAEAAGFESGRRTEGLGPDLRPAQSRPEGAEPSAFEQGWSDRSAFDRGPEEPSRAAFDRGSAEPSRAAFERGSAEPSRAGIDSAPVDGSRPGGFEATEASRAGFDSGLADASASGEVGQERRSPAFEPVRRESPYQEQAAYPEQPVSAAPSGYADTFGGPGEDVAAGVESWPETRTGPALEDEPAMGLGLGARLAALQAQSGGFAMITPDEPQVDEAPAGIARGIWDPKVPPVPAEPDEGETSAPFSEAGSPGGSRTPSPEETAWDVATSRPEPEPELDAEPEPARGPGPEPEPVWNYADYPPANSTEEELLEATRTKTSNQMLSTLLLAKVLIPGYAADPVHWPAEEIRGGRYLVAFTSMQRLTAHYEATLPEPEPVRFTTVIAKWPSDEIGFALNPGTPMGRLLSGSEVRGLARSAAEFGLIDADALVAVADAEEASAQTQVIPEKKAPEPAVSDQPMLMQRTVAASQVSMYLDRGYDRVCGFVHRAAELAHLSRPAELYRALGLAYPESPFNLDDTEVYVLRWPAHLKSMYRIPFGGQTHEAMNAMQGWMIERAPYRGNGFAPSESGDVVAEFKIDSTRLPHGAQLWRLSSDGIETLVALFDADGTRWRRIGSGEQ